jgi:hypothetical protein
MCAEDAGCAAGRTCSVVFGTPVCSAPCSTHGEPCAADGPRSACVVDRCSAGCDPFAQTGCGDAACDVFVAYVMFDGGDGNFSYADCRAAGTGDIDASCTDGTQCLPGLVCVTDECRKLCDIADPTPDCPGGEACVAFHPPLGASPPQYGFCPDLA